jgi:hypothetical protein
MESTYFNERFKKNSLFKVCLEIYLKEFTCLLNLSILTESFSEIILFSEENANKEKDKNKK